MKEIERKKIGIIVITGLIICLLQAGLIIKEKNNAVVPAASCEIKTLVNKLSNIECDICFIIYSKGSKTMGLFIKPDYSAHLHLKSEQGMIKPKINKDRIPNKTMVYKSYKKLNNEILSIVNDYDLLSSSNADNTQPIISTADVGDYIIAFLSYIPHETEGNTGFFYIFRKETKDLLYLAALSLNEDYCFRASSGSMIIGRFEIK